MWSAAYMSAGLKARDHRVEPLLLFGLERLVRRRDERVGERVVIQRCVGLQVIPGREIARVPVLPHLLQRQAKQRRALHDPVHHAQVVVDVRAFLDVVRQVEVRIAIDILRLRLVLRGRDAGE
jgi:hypothetical protein